jgi:hypothetical protein
LTAAFLALSGFGDLAGGLWAAFDWRGAAGFLARHVPGWQAQRDAVGIAFADDALRQLWVNLGTALAAVGVVQLVAAQWVARGREEGDTLARVLAFCLILAAGAIAVCADQPSSMFTEGVRGIVLLGLITWTRTVEGAGGAAGTGGAAAGS